MMEMLLNFGIGDDFFFYLTFWLLLKSNVGTWYKKKKKLNAFLKKTFFAIFEIKFRQFRQVPIPPFFPAKISSLRVGAMTYTPFLRFWGSRLLSYQKRTNL